MTIINIHLDSIHQNQDPKHKRNVKNPKGMSSIFALIKIRQRKAKKSKTQIYAAGFSPEPKWQQAIHRHPHKVAGIVALCTLAVGLTIAGINLLPERSKIPQTVVQTKQLSAAVAQGSLLHWVKIIDTADLDTKQHLLDIPKNASHITIAYLTKAQADRVISFKTPTAKLAMNDRRLLASRQVAIAPRANAHQNIALALVNLFKKMMADVSDAITPSAITPDTSTQTVDINNTQNTDTQSGTQVTGQDSTNTTSSTPTTQDTLSTTATDSTLPTSLPDLSNTTTDGNQTTLTQSTPDTLPGILGTNTDDSSIVTVTNLPHLSGTNSNGSQVATNQQTPASKKDDVIAVQYDTPAPTISEQETGTGKLVTVSASPASEDPSTPIIDVVAHTTIPKIYKVGQESRIQIKWKNNGDQNVTFHAYDTNNDGYLDYVEWTVPHLSDQTFEIIFISKAFQLDESQNIVADIYDQVQSKDQIFGTIPTTNYIRFTFGQTVASKNDITIYARPTDDAHPGSISVFPVYVDSNGNFTEGSQLQTVSDGTNPDFSNIDHDGKYRILLKNLQIPTDTFDLKIVNAGIDIDYIVDPNTVAVLVVAGGGGGGRYYGGGGGGGGVVYNSAFAITGQTYNITVGSGGTAAPSNFINGGNGGNSVFATITAIGGGGGGATNANNGAGLSGGSGGGGSPTGAGAGGSATPGQGNAGGNASGNGGGGGGGAGSVGSDATAGFAGNGGAGISYSISGAAVTYAGGGGGSSGNPGSGGSGGGGSGANESVAANSGTANTGGGGGGGSNPEPAGAGGSGIVIVSFPTGSLAVTATGTYTTTTSGGNTIYTFTGNGTFTPTSISVSGTVYTNEGITTMGSGRTVAISVNGAAAAGTTTTASDGTYTVSGLISNAGDILTVYLQGNTEKGVTVTVGTGSNMTGVNIYQNDLVTLQGNASSLTNANLATAATNADSGIAAIYSVSGSVVTVAPGKNLYIPASNTFAPGGNVIVGGNFTNNGTYTKGTETLIINGTSASTLKTGSSTLNNLTINDGLVGYWKGDEGSGTTATDSSGYGNNGTLTNGATYSSSVPTTNFTDPHSFSFDGVDDYVSVTGTSNLPTASTAPYTISMWLKPTTTTNGTVVFVLGDPSGADGGIRGLFVHPFSGGPNQIWIWGANRDVATGVNFDIGSWQLITFTADTSTLSVYKNGSLIYSGARPANTNAANQLKFGFDTSGYSWEKAFSGNIDDVRIYNRALSPTEISALAAGNEPATSVATTTLNSALTVSGDLTLNGGTLDTASGSNYAVNVAGNWYNNGGVFTPRSGTVTLNGTSSGKTLLSGGQSFNNLYLNNGLVGYWKGDEGSGTTAIDSSGYGNTGTLTNGATYSSSIPTTSFTNPHSFSFDGVDDYVSIPYSNVLHPRQITVSYWVQLPTTDIGGLLGTGRPFFTNTGYDSGVYNNKIYIDVGNGSSAVQLFDTVAESTNTWFHITFTYNGSTVVLYKNGVAVANGSLAGSISDPNLGLSFGTNTNNGAKQALLDDVRIYNRALSPTEVAALAAGNQPASAATTTLGSAITTTGTLALQSQTLDASSSNYAISVAGNWQNDGGTLTAQNGTVTLNGTSQNIFGSTSFYNLTKSVSSADTLTFDAGQTQTVSGTWTASGASGNLLSLRSSVSGTQWKINPSGTRTISYLDVKDSNNTNGTGIATLGNNITNSGNNTNWIFNTAPTISTGPSDGGSYSGAPTNVGSNVNFTATATDTQGDNYYLAICKTNAITAVNSGAPTCPGGAWAVSSSTASGAQASASYTALAGDPESNGWYAFVCDNNAASMCSASSQGSANTGSPFAVNHAPSFTSISNTAGTLVVGQQVLFLSTSSDSDVDGTADTVTLYVCKANDFTGTACGAGGEYCHSSSGASNPSCSYTVTSNDGQAAHTYYANIVDNHAFGSTANPRSATFTTDTVAPVLTETAGAPGGSSTQPNYTFTSTEAGTITYGGDCTATLTNASAGNNTITVNTTSLGLHSNCTIVVTDAVGNVSLPLTISSFTVYAAGNGGGATYSPSPATSLPSVSIPANLPQVIAQGISQIPEAISNQITNIINAFNPPATQPATPPAVTIPQETPLALQGWKLFDIKSGKELGLLPINSDIGFFAKKVPQLNETLKTLGVNYQNLKDAQKLNGISLYLPGLTQTALKQVETSPQNFAPAIPLANLSDSIKHNIPTDVVFARTAGELIDYSMALLFDKNGNASQQINTLAGKPLQLVIKPEFEAKRVTALLTLKSANPTATNTSLSNPLASLSNILSDFTHLFAAAITGSKDMATVDAANSSDNQQKLLVQRFEYTKGADGIYRAEITAPIVEGNYEVMTIIEYQDPKLIPKETHLTVVVDPEGYVYRQDPDGRLRIQNATVSIYWLNSATHQYELWPADKFLQKTPSSPMKQANTHS